MSEAPELQTFTVRHRECKNCHGVTSERASEPLWSGLGVVGKRLLPHLPCCHCGAVIVSIDSPPPRGWMWLDGPPLGATMGRDRNGKIRIRL